MNKDRRVIAQICIELLKECNETGLINDDSHVALTDAVKHLTAQEFWQIKNQERHEGKNATTDSQLSICRVALPALEQAARELGKTEPDYTAVIDHLHLAITTDGTVPSKRRK